MMKLQLLFGIFLSLLLLVQTNLAYSQTNSSSPALTCTQKMISEEYTDGSAVDKTKAISLAESSDEYKSKIQGYDVSSPNVYEEWILNQNTCSVTLRDVGVAFFLNDSKGDAKTMEVTLDPSLTKILNLVVRDAVTYGVGSQNTTAAPEFPFAEFVLLISVASLIVFYRLHLQSKLNIPTKVSPK
jgi:hypothetical protein